MTQTSASGQETEAVLVGSLGVFALPDVLTLAATSGAHGRLAVTAAGVDGHLWMEDGDLTGFLAGDAATLTEAVFDLALVTDGWFSFFPGGEAPAPADRRSVSDVLAEVEPQVAEWQGLVGRISLDGIVHLSPTAPGAEVQIRADQWHVLTTISTTGSARPRRPRRHGVGIRRGPAPRRRAPRLRPHRDGRDGRRVRPDVTGEHHGSRRTVERLDHPGRLLGPPALGRRTGHQRPARAALGGRGPSPSGRHRPLGPAAPRPRARHPERLVRIVHPACVTRGRAGETPASPAP